MDNTTVLSLNALPTSSVMIPIVFPSDTDVIINGIVLTERMRITALILNVTVYSSQKDEGQIAPIFWGSATPRKILDPPLEIAKGLLRSRATLYIKVSDGTDGRTDRRYQVHYLPRFAADSNDRSLGPHPYLLSHFCFAKAR